MKLLVKPVGYEIMNPVQLALFGARFQLAFMHGAHVFRRTGEGDELIERVIDNLEYIALIDNANAWLDTPAGKDFLSSSAPQNSHS